MKSNPWKAGRRWLAGTVAAWLGTAAIAGAAGPSEAPPPLIPVEDFARAPRYVDMQLSPDGAVIAFRTFQDESSGLGFFSIDKMKAEEMMWGEKGFSVAGKNNAVFGYHWVSPNRVVACTALGWAGSNSDFSYFKYLTGWGRWSEERERPGIASSMVFFPIGIVPDGRLDPRSVLVTNTPDISDAEVRPDVLEMNTVDGSFHLVEKNPATCATGAPTGTGRSASD